MAPHSRWASRKPYRPWGAYTAGSPMIKGQPALGFAVQGKSFRAPRPLNPKPRGS